MLTSTFNEMTPYGVEHISIWRGYGIAYLAIAVWAGIALIVNTITGANYGYLSRSPKGASFLDLLGLWPIYIFWEAVIITVVAALMTWPWQTKVGWRHAIVDRLGTVLPKPISLDGYTGFDSRGLCCVVTFSTCDVATLSTRDATTLSTSLFEGFSSDHQPCAQLLVKMMRGMVTPLSPAVRRKIIAFDPSDPAAVTVSEFCKTLKISRRSFYTIRQRYAEESKAALPPRSSAPHTTRRVYDESVTRVLLAARADLTSRGWDYGPMSIRFEIAIEQLLDPPIPSVSTSARLLRAAGEAETNPKKRPKSSYVRFQRDQAMALWQIDAFEYKLFVHTGSKVTIYQVLMMPPAKIWVPLRLLIQKTPKMR